MDLTTMPFIVLVVYFITWCLKKWVFKTNNARKNLPPIAAAMGCGIALLIFFRAPELGPFENVIDAATQGMASGLAAVGCNQVYKQYQKFKTVDNLDDSEDIPVAEVSETVASTASKNEVVNTPNGDVEPIDNSAYDDDRVGG